MATGRRADSGTAKRSRSSRPLWRGRCRSTPAVQRAVGAARLVHNGIAVCAEIPGSATPTGCRPMTAIITTGCTSPSFWLTIHPIGPTCWRCTRRSARPQPPASAARYADTAGAAAAVAIGDPDDRHQRRGHPPGLNTTVAGSMVGMTTEASNLRQEALRQLGNTPVTRTTRSRRSRGSGTTCPRSPGGTTAPGRFRAAGGPATTNRRTRAQNLAHFYDGLQSAHDGGPAHLTASGTLMARSPPGWPCRIRAITGSATRSSTAHPASRRSPRTSCSCSRGTSPPWRPRTTRFRASTTPSPWEPALVPGPGPRWRRGRDRDGGFRPEPGQQPELHPHGHRPRRVPDGHGGTVNLEGARGHSDYPRWGGNNLPRTTGYNIAAVVAGLPNDVVPQN